MVLHVSEGKFARNAPVEKLPFSEVVAPYKRFVPQANPRVVGALPPISVMVAFNVAVVEEILEAAEVVMVGGLVFDPIVTLWSDGLIVLSLVVNNALY